MGSHRSSWSLCQARPRSPIEPGVRIRQRRRPRPASHLRRARRPPAPRLTSWLSSSSVSSVSDISFPVSGRLAIARLWRSNLPMWSSTVFSTMRWCAWTVSWRPMRWARSVTWSSTAGSSAGRSGSRGPRNPRGLEHAVMRHQTTMPTRGLPWSGCGHLPRKAVPAGQPWAGVCCQRPRRFPRQERWAGTLRTARGRDGVLRIGSATRTRKSSSVSRAGWPESRTAQTAASRW